MKSFFVFIFLFVFSPVFAQSGYLGKRTFVELNAGMVPSYRHLNVIRNDQAIQRLRLGNMSYGINAGHVFTRRFELTLGYEFARINCISDGMIYRQLDTIETYTGESYEIEYDQQFLDDPAMDYHGFQLAFNFYRLGSLAPVGKYAGFSIAYGIAKLEEGTPFVAGRRGVYEKDGFFRSVAPIGVKNELAIPTERIFKSTHLRACVGRNYPVTDYLMINVGMSFPIFSYYKSGLISRFGFGIENEYTEDHNSSWIGYGMRSLKSYNRITLEAGVRLLF
jgi:hypothetical protein